jgi:ATP-binding cassette, subfamily D (ALD), member 4
LYLSRIDTDDNDRDSADDLTTASSRPLLTVTPLIDNPDQRIAQDADSLCRTLSGIIPLLLISPFTIAYYTYRTWQITGYYGPLGILIYFLVWTCLNKIFISAVSRTIFRQNILEGNFRFLHTQVRSYHETIAFYHGGSFEHKRFDNYFVRSLAPILYRRTWQEFILGLSTNLFDYVGSILSYVLLVFAIFVFRFYDDATKDELVQIVSKTSFMTMYLIYRFSQLNDLTDKLTVIAANTHRVQAFVEYMKGIDTTWGEKQSYRPMPNSEVLQIKDLSYSTPNGGKYVLMKNLNLTLNVGQRLLITGSILSSLIHLQLHRRT